MTHLKMTHCFTVCVWKCLLYLFFPLFILEQMGPFQCHMRWWWSHFSTSDGRRTCRPGAPRAGTGSARQWRGGSPMAANTSHVQCEWRTYDCIQGWRCRFHALGRQGGRWLREFLWPHSHCSEDFVSEKSWVLKNLFSDVFGCGFHECSKVLFQIHFTLHLETLVVAEPAGVYMLCIFSHRDASHWWICIICSTAIYWSVWLLKCICTCYSASIRVLDVCDARNL